jgi:hypothetical protein
MRCNLPVLIGLLTLATPLVGQTRSGHVYDISYFQALPGKGGAYNKALAEITFPILDEMVKRKALVAYTALDQYSGAGEYTHVFILEFSDWAAFGAFRTRRDEAAQAVSHKSWSEAITGFADLRRPIRSETYVPAGQP